MIQKVSKNKLVSITYRILSDENEVVEQNDIPIDFVYGADDRMFPKIIQALEGKTIGDNVEVVLPPEEGFGREVPELIITTSIKSAPVIPVSGEHPRTEKYYQQCGLNERNGCARKIHCQRDS